MTIFEANDDAILTLFEDFAGTELSMLDPIVSGRRFDDAEPIRLIG